MLRWDGLTEKVRSINAFPEPSGETSALFSTVRPRLRGGGYKHSRCSSCSLERVLAQGAPVWSPKRPSVRSATAMHMCDPRVRLPRQPLPTQGLLLPRGKMHSH